MIDKAAKLGFEQGIKTAIACLKVAKEKGFSIDVAIESLEKTLGKYDAK